MTFYDEFRNATDIFCSGMLNHSNTRIATRMFSQPSSRFTLDIEGEI
ncbi:hypothetical protein T01_14893 [Trichinella spiralis]|uniref:Uncharacterized protein n=1 Tax=Trichinella spiralis TaxID=6334 RepID=A0A0V1AM84_TRISP|nr:hypothetical protein T01_14893 [Trichinella spiralis]